MVWAYGQPRSPFGAHRAIVALSPDSRILPHARQAVLVLQPWWACWEALRRSLNNLHHDNDITFRPLRDQLPWAAPFSAGAVGRSLSDEEAFAAFGWAFDEQAAYVIADGGIARRIVDDLDAERNGLSFVFSGEPCWNGHVEPRKLRASGATPVCLGCDQARKRRATMQRSTSD